MGITAGKCTSKVRLDGMTAIITGSNTGIGKYNALDFYKRGCRVIMACRDLSRGEKAKDDIRQKLQNVPSLGNLVVKRLDLSSLKSVRTFSDEIIKEEPKVQILINNAGVMMCPKSYTEDGFEMQFGTNHLGHFLLTLLLLPKIIESGPARIVNVSSVGHKLGDIDFEDLNCEKSYTPAKAYARSKLSNILFTVELAKRLEGTNVNVYALHPGVVRTELGRHMDSVVFPGFRTFYRIFLGWSMKTPEHGAQTNIYCALDEGLKNETGLYYSDCKVATPAPKATDAELAKKLWDVSWDLVKLGNYDPFVNKSKKDPS